MQIGINLWAWDSPFNSAKQLPLFEKVRGFGGEVVEFALEADAVIAPPEVRRALQDNHLGCSVVGLYGPPRDLSVAGAPQRAGLDYTLRSLELCAEVGATIFTGAVLGVGGDKLLSPEERQARLERCAEALRRVGDAAAAAGVRFVVEILNRYENNLLNTAAEGRALMALVQHPAVGLHLDSFHMNLEEQHLGDAIRLAGDTLGHFHGSDSQRGTPGDGLLRWDQVARGLHDIHYAGYVVIESFNHRSPLGPLAKAWRPYAASPDDLAQRGLAFLRQTLLTSDPQEPVA